jgi:hypothetical protein
MLQNILNAFHGAGFAKVTVEHDHEDGCFDLGCDFPLGWDVLHVEEKDNRILWHDFTHSTDLGPMNGSELVQRLTDHAHAVRNRPTGSRATLS